MLASVEVAVLGVVAVEQLSRSVRSSLDVALEQLDSPLSAVGLEMEEPAPSEMGNAAVPSPCCSINGTPPKDKEMIIYHFTTGVMVCFHALRHLILFHVFDALII